MKCVWEILHNKNPKATFLVFSLLIIYSLLIGGCSRDPSNDPRLRQLAKEYYKAINNNYEPHYEEIYLDLWLPIQRADANIIVCLKGMYRADIRDFKKNSKLRSLTNVRISVNKLDSPATLKHFADILAQDVELFAATFTFWEGYWEGYSNSRHYVKRTVMRHQFVARTENGFFLVFPYDTHDKIQALKNASSSFDSEKQYISWLNEKIKTVRHANQYAMDADVPLPMLVLAPIDNKLGNHFSTLHGRIEPIDPNFVSDAEFLFLCAWLGGSKRIEKQTDGFLFTKEISQGFHGSVMTKNSSWPINLGEMIERGLKVNSIAYVSNREDKRIGSYTDGTGASETTLYVTVVDISNGTILYKEKFQGSPPQHKPSSGYDFDNTRFVTYGIHEASSKAVNWLRGLPKR